MRRLRSAELVRLDRPLAVFVEPDYDSEGAGGWNAHIVGFELDNVTCGTDPADALEMAADVIRMFTGRCEHASGEHDWSVDTFLYTCDDDGNPVPTEVVAWGCSRCDERASKELFDE